MIHHICLCICLIIIFTFPTNSQFISVPLTVSRIKPDEYQQYQSADILPSISGDVNLLINVNAGNLNLDVTLDTSTDVWIISTLCKSTFCRYKERIQPPANEIDGISSDGLVKGFISRNTQLIISNNPVYHVQLNLLAATVVMQPLVSSLSPITEGVLGLMNASFQEIMDFITIHISSKGNALFCIGLPKGLPLHLNRQHRVYTRTNWKLKLDLVSSDEGAATMVPAGNYVPRSWKSSCLFDCNVVIDLKLYGISGPARDIEKLNAYIGVDQHGYIDCYQRNFLNPIVFNIGGSRYVLQAKNYIIESDEKFNHKCKSAFVPNYSNAFEWRIGLAFLRQYTVIYDTSVNQIVFVPADYYATFI